MGFRFFVIKVLKKLHLNSIGFRIGKMFCSRKVTNSPVSARALLSDFSPCPDGTAIRNTSADILAEYDLQIIVPAYNVEAYLEECMDSILAQKTRYSFRVYLIDDGATDRTPAIADRYAADPRVQVIHQINSGISGARNRALESLCGKYVTFVDSDDRLMPGAIENLMSVAIERDADIVQGGYALISPQGQMKAGRNYSATERVDACLKLHGFPWGSVIKSTFFTRLQFPEHFWYEDTVFSYLLYPSMTEMWQTAEIVYAYRMNRKGITFVSRSKKKCVDTYWITERMLAEHRSLNLPEDDAYMAKTLRQIILNANRVCRMPVSVRKSIFILTRELLLQYEMSDRESAEYEALLDAFRNCDFGAYENYCFFGC